MSMGLDEESTGLLPRLVELNRPLISKYDPEKAIELLDAVPAEKHYHYLAQDLQRLWSGVTDEFGELGFDAFQRITMLRLMDRFESRAVAHRYSQSIRDRFAISFGRIAKSIRDSGFDKYRSLNDILLKDLAICRQRMFPVGAEVMEKDSGFHRALIWRGGPLQSVRFLGLLLRTRGNKPFYCAHTHLSELEEFNPAGWDRSYLRIAEMLELHPEVKGLWGAGWMRDPALAKISPHLAYLRERPLQNGASLFYSGVDIHGGALSKSKTRQELYKQGKYLPKAYALIWPRRALLAWARDFARGNA